MKLLGWMHRKLRQNSIEPFKEFLTGNSFACLSTQPSIDDQQYYPDKEAYEDKSSSMIIMPFDGFLMIGTLGSEAIITQPSTPKLPMHFQKTTEKKAEVTENELKVINDELEKFFEAEAIEVGDESSERMNHDSIITICGKQIEFVDTKQYRDVVACPLQGYLFGSSIELPKPSIELTKGMASLEQLFNRNDIAYGHPTNEYEKGRDNTKRAYATRFIKKMLKKIHFSSRSSAASTGSGVASAADPVSTKQKLPKILRMFHKMVHPVKASVEESHKYEINKNSIDHGHNKEGQTLQKIHNSESPPRSMSKNEINNLNLSHKRLSSSDLSQKREHWIKTDADYLVLEL